MGMPNPYGHRAMAMWLERQAANRLTNRAAEQAARARLAKEEAAARAARDITPPDADD